MKSRFGFTSLVLLILLSSSMISGNSLSPVINTNAEKVFIPTAGPSLLFRTRTKNWIYDTQQVAANNGTSVDQIYYRLGAIRILDPTLTQVPQALKDHWSTQVQSFQNADGGFGQWKLDRSGISSTKKSVEILTWLGKLSSINTTEVAIFLDSLRNKLTNGYNSHSNDGDADIYTSSLAVETYYMLGEAIVNQSQLVDMFLRAENNASSLPTNEFGGYGKQTNNLKGIFWTSEATITHAAVTALTLMSASFNTSNPINFLKSLQGTNGGYYNDALLLSESASYTASALSTIYNLGATATDEALALQYLRNLEKADGGYVLKTTSVFSSVKGTFFALQGLDAMGQTALNSATTLSYLITNIPDNGGFGGAPGSDASLRESFDAVAALTYMGQPVLEKAKLLAYLDSYRNPDGGYGITGSYVESTLRVLEIYSMLNEAFPNPTQTTTFLKSLQQLDGGFSKGASVSVSYVISTYRAVRALELLSALPTNVASTVNYLKGTYNSTDGGFGGFFGDSSDVSSTYRAVRSLNILGDTSIDTAKVSGFLKNSQNPDGGFKRSSYNALRPKNVSSIVYTYAAMRALMLLGVQPNNETGIYNYIASTRNRDGGFAKHPKFTSDVAYTFTSLWMLDNLKDLVPFKVEVFGDVANISNDAQTIDMRVSGMAPLFYNISIAGTDTFFNATLSSAGNITLSLPSLALGNYTIDIYAEDLARHVISESFDIAIVVPTVSTSQTTTVHTSSTTTTPPTTSSTKSLDNSTLMLIGGILGAVLFIVTLPMIVKRGRK